MLAKSLQATRDDRSGSALRFTSSAAGTPGLAALSTSQVGGGSGPGR